MSVINQMLKDLDERSPELINQAAHRTSVAPTHSAKKIVVITALTVLISCLVCFYVWQIISENNALKAEQVLSKIAHQNNIIKVSSANNAVATSTIKPSPNNIETKSAQPDMEIVKGDTKAEKNQDTTITNAVIAPIAPSEYSAVKSNVVADNKLQPIAAKAIVNNNVSRVTPAKKAESLAEQQSHPENPISHGHIDKLAISEKVVTSNKSSGSKMSVSRRQLSADELAEQKLDLAEKALAAKQISKAEKLLEEVVIIKPADSQTRKKLAALWYGRKAYRNAVNLLSQGIALDKTDSTLRELKARIHLKQGQVTAALNTLKPLSQFKNEQYQVMLANVAQQAQQNEIAINAYKMLISMQPEIGRWHLGLAVLYDKNSQFSLASSAYKKALTKNDLSVSSESFIKQRIEVIGQ